MYERHQSHEASPRIVKHALNRNCTRFNLQRQTSRRLLHRRGSSVFSVSDKHVEDLPNNNNNNNNSCSNNNNNNSCSNNNNNNSCSNNNIIISDHQSTEKREISCRVRRLLLKHTKFGFIESFQDLTLTASTNVRKPSDSDQVVQLSMPENILHELTISAKIINKEEFELGRVLGAGGFGAVYLGTFRRQTVAIKVMHKYTKNPAAQLESFKAELHVMRFEHPHIVKTLAATHIDQFDDGAWVVMEYVGKASLQTVIDDNDVPFEADRRMKFSVQIASALAYAHKNKIAHLDLKPANVLITDKDDCKVGDFGCSQKVEFDTGIISPTNRSILTGTFAYRAPELLRGEPPTYKADIYSYGVTMWQMKSRETPFTNQNQHVVIFGVVAKGVRPRDPNPFETDPFELSYKDLYRQCWNACPLDRPSAHELVDLLGIWKENM